MKTLSVIVLLFVASCVTAQDIDQLKDRILKVELEQKEDDVRMAKFNKQYSNGTWLIIAGTGTLLINWFVYERQKNDNSFGIDPGNRKEIGFIIGGALITGGTALQIDAHRHLKKRIKRKR